MPSFQTKPHFVLFPFMAQGHMIPMVDFAKMIAKRGVVVTIVTTPINAARFEHIISSARELGGLAIQQVLLQFPSPEHTGLPQGCENFDMLPSLDLDWVFFKAAGELIRDQAESLLEGLSPRPSCIISDVFFPCTTLLASKLGIPRISFVTGSCFYNLCTRIFHANKANLLGSDNFVLQGLPDPELVFTKAQLTLKPDPRIDAFFEQQSAAELSSYGMIINSFEELEPGYVEACKKERGGGKVWCIGPVSLSNKQKLEKIRRGPCSLDDQKICLLVKWLDSQESSSVIYACFGSMSNLEPEQLIELGLGLEASGKPFIWVIRSNESSKPLDQWISDSGFEERIKGRGILMRGWVPQVLILSHSSIGGYLTHCGWNSTLEGVSVGVPFATWPLSGDQFCNDKLVVDVLKIGVRVGVQYPITWGNNGQLVKREEVKKAVEMLMDGGEEAQTRRARARELKNSAKTAVEEGGSSHLNMESLIQDIVQLQAETT